MPAPKGHPSYGGETGGRPIKYTKEFIEKEADILETWMKNNANLFIEDFAFERGYDDARIFEWIKINERFSDTYRRFKSRQKTTLFKGGLTRKFAHPMCALILSHSHNIVAKTHQVIDDSSNDLTSVLDEINGSSKDLVKKRN